MANENAKLTIRKEKKSLVAIKSQQWIYEIYDVLLYRWIDERSTERSETA